MPDASQPLALPVTASVGWPHPYTLRTFARGLRPEALVALTEAVALDEGESFKRALTEAAHRSARSALIAAFESGTGRLIGAILVGGDARAADGASHASAGATPARHAVFFGPLVDVEHRPFGLPSLLVYAATSWARRRGLGAIAAAAPTAATPLATLFAASTTWSDDGAALAAPVPVGRVASQAFAALGPSLRRLVTQRLMPDEVVRTARRGVARCHAGPWFEAAQQGALTRRGYEAGLVSFLRCHAHASATYAAALAAARTPAMRERFVALLGDASPAEQRLVRDLRALAVDAAADLAGLAPHPGVLSAGALLQGLAAHGPSAATTLVAAAVVEALLAWPNAAALAALEPRATRWTGDAALGVDFVRGCVADAPCEVDADARWPWDLLRAELAGRCEDELALQRTLSHLTALVAAFGWAMRDAARGPRAAGTSPREHAGSIWH